VQHARQQALYMADPDQPSATSGTDPSAQRQDSRDTIATKRDGGELSDREIEQFITGLVQGHIPDYQIAAWLMAVYLQGMTDRETFCLTLAMAHSGQVLDLHRAVPFAVDKHSTGGVGDKTSLVIVPLVCASGVPVAKLTGRGLGFTGGTVDKLESIPGFSANLGEEAFLDQLARIGVAVSGPTTDLAPADRMLYELRNATATIGSLPLIASSIMSKKIAAGADAIVLDVKVGSGTFAQTDAEARALAHTMVKLGKEADRAVTALLSDMSQPLGAAVGNALEVREAIATLRGGGPPDLRQHCIIIAGEMLLLGGKAADRTEARLLAQRRLDAGDALVKFRELIEEQGGDPSVIDNPTLMAQARWAQEVDSPQSGYITSLNAGRVGAAAVELGAGRRVKGADIDPAVGFEFPHKTGDFVSRGEPLFLIHANDEHRLERARRQVLSAFRWSDVPVSPPSGLQEIIE
jgi:pyrimidine-nucleoside phosphorylase